LSFGYISSFRDWWSHSKGVVISTKYWGDPAPSVHAPLWRSPIYVTEVAARKWRLGLLSQRNGFSGTLTTRLCLQHIHKNVRAPHTTGHCPVLDSLSLRTWRIEIGRSEQEITLCPSDSRLYLRLAASSNSRRQLQSATASTPKSSAGQFPSNLASADVLISGANPVFQGRALPIKADGIVLNDVIFGLSFASFTKSHA
jgi:hypothetical protein